MALSDEDLEYARQVAAAMPPWTQAELDDLARIVRSVPDHEDQPGTISPRRAS